MKTITFITMQLKTPGGIERFISTLATTFSKNYNIEIIANYGKSTDSLAFPLPKNIKLTFLTPSQPQEVSMKYLLLNFKWTLIPAELKRRQTINQTRNTTFQKYLKTLNTDFIITDRALYNSLVKKYYHGTAKKIATDHNYHQNNSKYIKELLTSIQGFDTLVIPSKELQAYYQPKVPSIKCHFIPNPLESIPSQKSPLNTKNLISVGRLVPEKDFSSLIKVMSKVNSKEPTAHLTIIGDGPEKTHLKNLIKSYHLDSNITLTGWLPQTQIAEYYYNSSLFAMTSKTEAFGLALTEAMSYGIPCIALDYASGAKAQLSNHLGILVSNTDEMAKVIIDLLSRPEELRKYQSHINHAIAQYSPEAIYQEWLKLLKTLS